MILISAGIVVAFFVLAFLISTVEGVYRLYEPWNPDEVDGNQ